MSQADGVSQALTYLHLGRMLRIDVILYGGPEAADLMISIELERFKI